MYLCLKIIFKTRRLCSQVNKLLRRFPTISNKNNTIRLAVSHIPLLGYADETTEKVIIFINLKD